MKSDFEDIGFIEAPTKEAEEKYTERFHLEGVDGRIASTYEEIKGGMTKLDPAIKVNPQKYYISLRKNKNFAYIKARKKKMHIVIIARALRNCQFPKRLGLLRKSREKPSKRFQRNKEVQQSFSKPLRTQVRFPAKSGISWEDQQLLSISPLL